MNFRVFLGWHGTDETAGSTLAWCGLGRVGVDTVSQNQCKYVATHKHPTQTSQRKGMCSVLITQKPKRDGHIRALRQCH